MFDPWKIDRRKQKLVDTSNYTLEKWETLNKLKLTPSAQRKLVSTIKIDKQVLEPQFPASFPLSNHPRVDDFIMITRPVVFDRKQDVAMALKDCVWEFKKNSKLDKRYTRSKAKILKETVALCSKSKLKLQSSINPNLPIAPIGSPMVDELYKYKFESLEPIFRHPARFAYYEKWCFNSKQDFQNVLNEMNTTAPLLAVQEQDTIAPMELSKYALDEVFIPKIAFKDQVLDRFISKSKSWKVKFSVKYVSSKKRDQLLDEPINKLEIKYKLSIPEFSPCKFINHFSVEFTRQWEFSQYKTYMMDWKPFQNMPLGLALEEANSSDVKIFELEEEEMMPITYYGMSKSNEEGKIKEITIPTEATKLKNINFEKDRSISTKTTKLSPAKSEETSTPIKIATNLKKDHKTISSNGDYIINSESQKVLESPIIQPPMTRFTKNSQISQTSQTSQASPISQNFKRQLSELDSLILKKKRKAAKHFCLENIKYPYLDILNQSTNLERTTKDDTSLPKTKEATPDSSINVINSPTIKAFNSNNILLDQTKIYNVDQSVFETKKCKIAIDITFSEKYGAIYQQFINLTQNIHNLQIIDIGSLGDGNDIYKNLKFDMFLNPTSGVFILRPINVYQIDLKTGENLVFQQLSNISYQISSLVIVILIEKALDMTKDIKLEKFINTAEKMGIQIYIVDNESKMVAISILELIEKYADFEESTIEDKDFEWTKEYDFLEACGIQNVLLSEWILKQWNHDIESFINCEARERYRVLEEKCSEELADQICERMREFV